MEQNGNTSARSRQIIIALGAIILIVGGILGTKRYFATSKPLLAPITVNATVKDLWTGGPTGGVESGDGVFYSPGSTGATGGITGSTGLASFTVNFGTGPVIAQACANNEICGLAFNQPFTIIGNDVNLIAPTFEIENLGGPTDTILLHVTVTDLAGNVRSGDNVQVTQGGVNYGSKILTHSNGQINYGKGLAQNTTYVVGSSGASGGASVTVTTSALTGATGLFSGVGAYIRY